MALAVEDDMKIYLASRYSRNEEMRAVAADLIAQGHEVTSRWIQGDHQIDDAGLSAQAAEAERIRFAQEDWADLLAADCCLSFTEVPRTEKTRGGRHVEFGAALALGKDCIVVGHRENVFHCLPQVDFYATWAEALSTLMHPADLTESL